METVFRLNKIDFIFNDKIEARLYGRTLDDKKICLTEFTYDYIIVDLTNQKKKELIERLSSLVENLKFETFNAEINDFEIPVLKIFTTNLNTTEILSKYLLEQNIQCFEHDLAFNKKYLLEKQLELNKIYQISFVEEKHDLNVDYYGNLDKLQKIDDNSINIFPNVLFFDLETFDDGGGINYKKNPILMISVFHKKFKTVLVAKSYPSKKGIEVFQSEIDMLRRFKEIILDIKPDCISGYNIKGFDIPYLIERFKLHDESFKLSSFFGEIEELNTKRKFSIDGILIFDIFQMIKNIFKTSINNGSYSLNSVSEELLGEKKVEVNLINLSKDWVNNDHSNFDLYANYCFVDSELCDKLYAYFEKDILEMTNLLNIDLEEISEISSSQVVENFLINNARFFNQIIPNKPDVDEVKSRKNRRIQGAFVFDPTPGYYENIAVFDFTSLYPTIIESHNITKGTVTLVNEKNSLKVPERNYYIKQSVNNKKAFIPSIIGDIVTRRIRIKSMLKELETKGNKSTPIIEENEKKLLKARLNNLKLMANSLYGYIAFYMARWYSFEAADAITAFARYNIKKVISTFEEKGFKIIYSDTDSVFVLLNDKTINDAQNLVDDINKNLPGLMSLEKEDLFKCGIFVGQKGSIKGAKKKYALLSYKDKFKIVGLAMIRGDWSLVSKKIQEEVIKILLKEKNVQKAIDYVKKEILNESLLKRPLLDFVISTKLKKPVNEYENKGPHVIIAEKRIKKGETIRVGSIISYIISKDEKETISGRAKLPNDISINEVDLEYYKNNQIIPVLEGIFEAFHIPIKEQLNKKNKSLESFFS